MVELNRAHTFASSSSLASSTSSSPPSTPTAHGLRHNSSSSSLAGSAGGLSYEDHLSASSYRARPSRFLKLVNWWHMLSVYFPAILYALIAVLVAQLFVDVSDHGREIKEFVHMVESVKTVGLSLLMKVTPLFILGLWWVTNKHRPIYLVNFATYKPPQSWKVSQSDVMEIMKRKGCFTEKSLEFMERILTNSGTGPSTAWPPGILKLLRRKMEKEEGDEAEGLDVDGEDEGEVTADQTEEGAREEAEAVIYGAVQDVLDKTGVKPKEIDILIINCSLFSPTPSLCAMVAHHFQMRQDVLSFNLAGMGCSAGLVSIDLAKRLLESRPRSRALVVSTENLTQAFYHGNDRAFLLQNTLFRCGGAAVLLSNRVQDGLRAKFKLLHVVRSQGTDKHSYDAVYSTQDDEGEKGVRLSKDIVKVAGRLMEKNLTAIGPKVLSVGEMGKAILTLVARKACHALRRFFKARGWSTLQHAVPEVKVYTPNFSRCVDFYCLHAGGRGVLDGIEKNLQLLPEHLEPSRMTLYDYGNTSSSSIWYEMEYICEKMDLRRGQRVLQVAFGSGFKCNSAVWVSLHV
ncbi:3-ketoacyl-synthase 11-like [Nannochloropsis oceanica]